MEHSCLHECIPISVILRLMLRHVKADTAGTNFNQMIWLGQQIIWVLQPNTVQRDGWPLTGFNSSDLRLPWSSSGSPPAMQLVDLRLQLGGFLDDPYRG